MKGTSFLHFHSFIISLPTFLLSLPLPLPSLLYFSVDYHKIILFPSLFPPIQVFPPLTHLYFLHRIRLSIFRQKNSSQNLLSFVISFLSVFFETVFAQSFYSPARLFHLPIPSSLPTCPFECLKVHKNKNFFGFDFEYCAISLLVMHN